jgi:hypothetical protein
MGDPRAAKRANDLRVLYGVRAAIAPMAISRQFTFLGKAQAESNIPYAVLSILWAG